MENSFEIYDDLFEPILVLDSKYNVVYFNQALLVAFQLTPRKVKNLDHLKDIFNSHWDDVHKIIEESFKSSSSSTSKEFSFSFNETSYTVVCRTKFLEGKVVLSVNDLSVEKKLYEKYKIQLEQLRSSHNQVVQADKLRVIGELTAGVSHEINNPLTVACGNTEILGFMLDTEDLNSKRKEITECIGNIEESHKRIQTIIANMKEFLHTKDEEDKEYCSLNELIDKSCSFIQKMYEEAGVKLKIENSKKTIVGWINRGKFEQVVINLLQNSLDAVSHGIDKPEVVIRLGKSSDDNQIHLSVTDNGPGVNKGDFDKIFDTFYTTKDVGKGTGLGLSISKRIMEAHQGDLTYIPSDSGACFKVTLPVVEVSSFAGNDAFLGKIDDKEGVRVLVVDNDVQVLNLCHKFFEKTPFVFIGSTSGEDALMLLEKMQVDVVITDVNMPDLDGRLFIKKIREKKLRPKVFYLSSKESMSFFNEDKEVLDLTGFIIKPFTKDELLSPLEKING
tara:strand:+ start:7997 stop:9508 length:1512 start_codon:yes stop_codon:yes gene_type:complete